VRTGGRPPARPSAPRRRRLGTLLALVGLLAVLAVTFTAGALAGRLSLRPSASSAQSADRTAKSTVPPTPELTFYRELTAPLAHRPVPPKPTARPGKRDVPPAEPTRVAEPAPAEGERHAEPPKAADALRAKPVETAKTAELPKPPEASPRSEAGRYTIQVGAYNGRAQAEALKARLLAEGHDAYVAEADGNGVTRYKVRIGSFPSHDEARKAAARLASRSQVATYVTTR
jgi:DedD protein